MTASLPYTYSVFGMTIGSELQCPELISAKKPYDVTIRLAVIPLKKPINEAASYFWQAHENSFFLQVNGVGKYLVTNGTTIIIEPFNNKEQTALRLFLLGSVFGALLHQRNIFPLHASVIHKKDITIAFTGNQGAGKSTMATAGLRACYSLLTDDICPLKTSPNKKPYVLPGYPLVKLLANTTKLFNIRQENLDVYHPESQKFRLPVATFTQDIAPLDVIVALDDENTNSEFTSSKPGGIDKLKIILNNTYRFEYINPLGLIEKHFAHVSFLTKNIKMIRLTGWLNRPHPDTILRQIENEIKLHL